MFQNRSEFIAKVSAHLVAGHDNELAEQAFDQLRVSLRDFPGPIEKLPERTMYARLVVAAYIREQRGELDLGANNVSICQNRPDFGPFVVQEFTSLLEALKIKTPVGEPYNLIDPPISVLDVLATTHLVTSGYICNTACEGIEARLNSAINQFTSDPDEKMQQTAYGELSAIQRREG